MFKVGIIGDGYTAADLLRLLTRHDYIEPVYISSTENIGKKIYELYPNLIGFSNLTCEKTNIDKVKEVCDAVFLALPHGLSVPMVRDLSKANIKCVDLGADFRLKDSSIYEKYYDMVHESPEMLTDAVYGLPELYREQIKKAQIVANPGCFPTGAIVPLAPLLQAGVIENEGIIIDSKSGVSGAGRTPKTASHFCEVNEGLKAYGVGTHRHSPEIAQELKFAAGNKTQLIFTPHLVPMNRGILTTAYSRIRSGINPSKIRQLIEDKYNNEYFIRILPEGVFPNTKWVYGTNFIDIGIYVDNETGQAIIVSAIDNLTKGASGQAIQNLNLMLGLKENEGLKLVGLHP
ncbi:N-acetyl-gamma-glutamyl-phosphate reductase [Candidatus Syntrophocurvum alkaliphilum]|uniref:N-acetyl-gamma-glutamyl-phosphate reductase n=1 Tax=Candidatus Syntrophocurvum alkaliphilum TaxID=2293317 RepID=A0A6I6DPZ7_9FIRM|nr:N-acetyl-gamma-glutamyl-phosphate reductase [Candidatus Syntrophocurvum alkaliphilum]QGU00818.1 N-acetyl-gamma-glutamyl-phosphate reductase [Candidatus Syntrophocurvum alkaliphilum]